MIQNSLDLSMKGRKDCGKKEKSLVNSNLAISPFPTMLLKANSPRSLTHYLTVLYFDALKIYSCGKHRKKRRNCL